MSPHQSERPDSRISPQTFVKSTAEPTYQVGVDSLSSLIWGSDVETGLIGKLDALKRKLMQKLFLSRRRMQY